MKRLVAIATLLILLVATGGQAQGLSSAAPEEVGLSAERLTRLDTVIQRYVDENAISGAVALIARRGRQAHVQAYGLADRETGTPMRADAIFRIASMSKPITSVAVLMLYEEGHFKLNDPIGQYLPALSALDVLEANPGETGFERVAATRPVTIRHLLTHTSGITYRFLGDYPGPTAKQLALSKLYGDADIADGLAEHDGTIEGLVTTLGNLPLMHQPGAAFTYGLSTDVLGRLVEVVSGLSFDEFLRTRLFRPLGMKDSFFYVPAHKTDRIASLYAPQGNGLVKVEGTVEGSHLTFSSTYSAGEPRTNYSGGAGLASTAHDYARFLQMLLNGGELDGVRLLSPMTVALMTTDHIGQITVSSIVAPGSGGFGLGVAIRGEPGRVGELGSAGSFNWRGFFNTMFWVDPAQELVAILLTQVRPSGSDIQDRFRIMTYQAIVD